MTCASSITHFVAKALSMILIQWELQAWCVGLSQQCHFAAMEYNVPLFRLSTLYSFFIYVLLAERLTYISRALGFPFFMVGENCDTFERPDLM